MTEFFNLNSFRKFRHNIIYAEYIPFFTKNITQKVNLDIILKIDTTLLISRYDTHF